MVMRICSELSETLIKVAKWHEHWPKLEACLPLHLLEGQKVFNNCLIAHVEVKWVICIITVILDICIFTGNTANKMYSHIGRKALRAIWGSWLRAIWEFWAVLSTGYPKTGNIFTWPSYGPHPRHQPVHTSLLMLNTKYCYILIVIVTNDMHTTPFLKTTCDNYLCKKNI